MKWVEFEGIIKQDVAGWRTAFLEAANELITENKPRKVFIADAGELTAKELKARVPLLDVIKQYVAVTVRGKRGYAKCLWHKDDRPSLVIDNNLYHCFAGCSSGDVFNFLMKVENLDFKQALDVLKKICN